MKIWTVSYSDNSGHDTCPFLIDENTEKLIKWMIDRDWFLMRSELTEVENEPYTPDSEA